MESVTVMHEVKTREQRKALNSWAKNGYCGSIIAGTGFGKSRCGVLAVCHVIDNVNKSETKHEARALVLVPTTQLQDQFTEEFSKWGKDSYLSNIEVLCYQSAYKLVDEHYDIVVCDEVHLGLSPQYGKFFENNKYDSLLCLTATLPEEEEYRIKLKELAPVDYQISIDKCVELGLVSPYEVHCLPITLTDEEAKDYKKVNNKFVYWKYQLGQFDAFNEAKRALANKNAPPEKKQAAAQFYNCIRTRKKIVDHAHNKIEGLTEIIEDHPEEKIIVFGGANAFTNELAFANEEVATIYHSARTKKQRTQALEDFRDGTKRVLCSTKALNQGFDVPDASVGVICGLTSKSLSMIQRVGRLIRFKEDKIGKIYILYVKDSQEEKWLNNSVQKLKNVVWH